MNASFPIALRRPVELTMVTVARLVGACHSLCEEPYKQRIANDYGTDKDALQVAFGQEAALFFLALQEELLDRHNALTGDLRSTHVDDGPVPVWNEAVFCYEAHYEERDPTTNDDLTIYVTLTLYANVDNVPPGTGGLPASVKDNEVVPDVDPTSTNGALVFEHGFLLHFGNGGRVDPYKDKAHRWLRCRASGHPVYAPRRLIRIVTPHRERLPNNEPTKELRDIREFVLGNSWVTRELVSSGLAKIRKKYSEVFT